jgi:hypothetical protein
MPESLTTTDYKDILRFYNEKIPKGKKKIERKSKKTLVSKLCRCIKKIKKNVTDEPRAIGVCSRSVFNTKGLIRGSFKCIGNKTLNLKKRANNNILSRKLERKINRNKTNKTNKKKSKTLKNK